MSFTIASFNVKNLIRPDTVYYPFESLTPEAYAWKRDWLSDQLLQMDADIVGFQEIFDARSLRDVIADCDTKGIEVNEFSQPGRDKRYRRRAIYRNLKYRPYGDKPNLVIAPNMHSVEEDGRRRPGIAMLSRFPILEHEAIQDLSDDPLATGFEQLGGGEAGSWRLSKLSRPVQRIVIDINGHAVTVFNAHLKSKHGEYDRDASGARPAENLLDYDPLGRAMGALRAALRRMGEALVIRKMILKELALGRPVIVLGDMNDALTSVSSEIMAGERPFKNYAWMRRHDAERENDRYSDDENDLIQTAVRGAMLESAEKMFVRRAQRDMIYTAAFNGVYESIDLILLSAHFQEGATEQIARLDYLQCFNDHLTDGSFVEAPYNKLASDHGQLVATISWLSDERR
ncbi:MAG: endonuclease/exonuclease/phosphatase family protein [Pseudomonadota bacterium]